MRKEETKNTLSFPRCGWCEPCTFRDARQDGCCVTKASFSKKSLSFLWHPSTNAVGTPEAAGMATHVPESGPPDTVVGGRDVALAGPRAGSQAGGRGAVQGRPRARAGRHAQPRRPGPRGMPAVPKENAELAILGNRT